MSKGNKYQKGGLSTQGYKRSSPDRHNDFNIIPSGHITMMDVPHPVMGMDNYGNKKLMMPGNNYKFPGDTVTEIPVNGEWDDSTGYNLNLPANTFIQYDPRAWDGDRIVQAGINIPFKATGGSYKNSDMKKKKTGYSGTYANGVYFEEGGPTFPVGGASPLFANGGYMGVNPFAMWPGPGTGGGMLQDLPNNMQYGGVNPFAMNPGSGQGNGMLQEYANEHMRMGGKPCYNCGGKYMQAGGGTVTQQPLYDAQHNVIGYTPKFSNMDYASAMNYLRSNGQSPSMYKEMWANFRPGTTSDQWNPYSSPTAKAAPAKNAELTHEGGQSIWAGQGVNFRSPDPDQGGYAYIPETVGIGAHGDIFGNAHGPMRNGGMIQEDQMKSGGHWIQHAVNPAHKGYCTPMSKPTCTGKRRAFAETMKKHHGFHEMGGQANPFHPLTKFMQNGGVNPWETVNPNDAIMSDMYAQRDHTADIINENPDIYSGRSSVSGSQPEGMTPMQNNITPGQQARQGAAAPAKFNKWNSISRTANATLGTLGTGLAIASAYNDLSNQRDNAAYMRQRGTSDNIPAINQPGYLGDWDRQGAFRPNQNTPYHPGMFYPQMQMGGNYREGQEVDMDDAEIERLRKLGYKIDIL